MAQITCYFGNTGCGKSTFIAQKATKLLKQGKRVLTVGIDIVGVESFDMFNIDLDIYPPYNSTLLIDESGIDFNNQHTFSNALRRFFKLHRHAEIDILYFSQCVDDTNIVIRRLTTQYYYVKKLPLFSVAIPVNSALVVKPLNPNAGIFDKYRGYGDFQTAFKIGNILSRGTQLVFRPLYYKKFDTHTLPQSVHCMP